MKDLARGIAVLGIWGCVAVVGYKDPLAAFSVGILAVIATAFVFSK